MQASMRSGAMHGVLMAGWENIGELITVIAIFIFVVAVTYFTTRFIGTFERERLRGSNIEVIESQRVAANKYIMIVRVADKMIAVSVSKNEMRMLTELDKDCVQKLAGSGKVEAIPFKDVLNRAKAKLTHKK
ncbi:MAG: flagellar biosynthetic protein FliO [Lachnospiraceae bacterium]|nr:flagellar biosynthetic protein FliO [Lachnospiraceae bacterium]